MTPPLGLAVPCRLSIGSAPVLGEIEGLSNRPPWSERSIAEEFSNSWSSVFGVRSGGDVVAFVICHTVADEAHIVNFAVRPSHRRRGIGRLLLGYLIQELQDRAIRWATLEVRPTNSAARALYEDLGFFASGRRPHYYSDDGEDAIIMTLNVLDFMNRAVNG